MSQSNTGNGGQNAQEKDFFKSLVSLALADGRITHEEYDMLYIVGKKVGATHDDVDEMIKNAGSGEPIAIGDELTNRKRLINLIRMMWADGEMDEKELELVQRFTEGLGFPKGKINDLVKTISEMVVEEREEEEILNALK